MDRRGLDAPRLIEGSRPFARLALLLALFAVSPLSMKAQAIVVRAVDDVSGLPIPQALVILLDATGAELGRRTSDIDGVVRWSGVRAAVVRVVAVGYAPLEMPPTETEVIARLEVRPIELEGLVGRVDGTSGASQFSRRRSLGRGIFLDPVDVALKSRYGVREVFRDVEGVRRTEWSGGGPKIVSSLGGGCFGYRLNDLPVRVDSGRNAWETYPLDGILPNDLVAVEVYRYFGEVPEDLRHNAAIGGGLCGLIVLWTREGWGSRGGGR